MKQRLTPYKIMWVLLFLDDFYLQKLVGFGIFTDFFEDMCQKCRANGASFQGLLQEEKAHDWL